MRLDAGTRRCGTPAGLAIGVAGCLCSGSSSPAAGRVATSIDWNFFFDSIFRPTG